MGVGYRIKEILRKRKMTIKQLAETTGIPVNTLYSITKRDSQRIDKVILKRISDALGITPIELLGIEVEGEDENGEYFTVEKNPFDKLSGIDGFSIDENGNFLIKFGSTAESVFRAEMLNIENSKYREYKLKTAWKQLNIDGQQKAVERIEELTEIPKYRRQKPQEPRSAPEQGTPTTAPESSTEGAQEPPESKSR